MRIFLPRGRRPALVAVVLRDGAPLNLSVPVRTKRNNVVRDPQGRYPPYFICGPLAFSTVSTQLVSSLISTSRPDAARTLLRTAAAMSADGNPILTRRGDRAAFPDEELVFVTTAMFPHRVARDYRSPTFRVLTSVNDVPVRNLAHLVELLRDATDEYLLFVFAGTGSERIVLPRKETMAAIDEILTEAGIRAQGSPEMLEIWNAGPGNN